MTDLKQIKTYITPEFKTKLSALLRENNIKQTNFINDAIREKALRDYDIDLGIASAPHGVRSDTLPAGWKSRLYRDRYQLVAIMTDLGIELVQLHEYDGGTVSTTAYTTRIIDEPEKIEVYAPVDMNEHDLSLAVMEWLNHV